MGAAHTHTHHTYTQKTHTPHPETYTETHKYTNTHMCTHTTHRENIELTKQDTSEFSNIPTALDTMDLTNL